MSKWEKLTEYASAHLQRGALLKFRAGYPFEDQVVMMVCEAPDKSPRKGLIAITGYKAGINCYVLLPCENVSGDLETKWLLENWQQWVWPGGNVEDVEIREALAVEDL